MWVDEVGLQLFWASSLNPKSILIIQFSNDILPLILQYLLDGSLPEVATPVRPNEGDGLLGKSSFLLLKLFGDVLVADGRKR